MSKNRRHHVIQTSKPVVEPPTDKKSVPLGHEERSAYQTIQEEFPNHPALDFILQLDRLHQALKAIVEAQGTFLDDEHMLRPATPDDTLVAIMGGLDCLFHDFEARCLLALFNMSGIEEIWDVVPDDAKRSVSQYAAFIMNQINRHIQMMKLQELLGLAGVDESGTLQ